MSEDSWVLSQFIGPDELVHGYSRKLSKPNDQTFENQAWITLLFQPQANRMPASKDLDVFEQFEERLIDRMEQVGIGTLVAVVTLEGKRDYLVYFLEESAFVEAVGGLLSGLSQFGPEISMRHDPDWEEWREL